LARLDAIHKMDAGASRPDCHEGIAVEPPEEKGFCLKCVYATSQSPEQTMAHRCPSCKKSDLLLVSETTDAVGKKRYRYKCPNCGETWPF